MMLGAKGDKVWIAKTFNCDNGKNIFIGRNFTGNYNLAILEHPRGVDWRHMMIGSNTLIVIVGHPLTPRTDGGIWASPTLSASATMCGLKVM